MRKLSAFAALTCALVVAAPGAAHATSSRAQATPAVNGTVWAIAFRGDIVYIGGSFTSVSFRGKTYPRKRLAAFSASSGAVLAWHPEANGTVRSLAVAERAVYAADDFDTIDRQRRDSLARIDALTGRLGSFSHSVSGEAATLAVGNGRLYVGGHFSAVDGAPRRNLAAFSHRTGALDRNWKPAADDRVRALASTRTRIYAGGDFRQVNGNRGAARLAAVGVADGRLVTSFRPKAPAVVLDVAATSSGVYSSTGGPGGRAVGYSTGGAVRWTHLFDGDVHTLTVKGGVTYVGGHFDRACRTTSTISQLGCPGGYTSRVKLAALDGSGRLTSWNPRADGVVGTQVLATDGRRVAAGGAFTRIGGVARERFALFN